jgi:hypothetical protein
VKQYAAGYFMDEVPVAAPAAIVVLLDRLLMIINRSMPPRDEGNHGLKPTIVKQLTCDATKIEMHMREFFAQPSM